MIDLLDTNILSALMSSRGDRRVETWMSAQKPEEIYTAAVCQAEIASGLAIRPEGRRRSQLQAAAQAMFVEDLEGRVLPFDVDAAIAFSRKATVVTRNVPDFEGCGVEFVTPWDLASL